jgi:hypothetical protein
LKINKQTLSNKEAAAAYADITPPNSLLHSINDRMENNFFFVDGLQADRASKKLMRRHVMKGKNAGKTFHRPSKANQVVRYHAMDRIARPIGTQFLTFPFPVPMTKVASKAIYDCELY